MKKRTAFLERDMSIITDAALVFIYGFIGGMMAMILLFFAMSEAGVL